MQKSLTVTWYRDNYGSIMQAFALQQTIMKTGIDNELLDFRFNFWDKLKFLITSSARHIIIKNKISNKLISFTYLSNVEKNLKRSRFNAFYDDFLKVSKPINNEKELKKANAEYNIFVCGSDQIWNPSYYKKCQFLHFADSKKVKFSYAASIGTEQLASNERERILKHIADFKAVSVRETIAKQLLEPYSDKKITVVCDPVFLVSKEEWIRKFELKNTGEKYLLCYFLGDDDEYWKLAKKLANTLNLDIKTIPNSLLDYVKGFGVDKTVGPREWLQLIYGASFVLTDSFHGTAFSLIFNKDFYVLKRFKDNDSKSQNSRIYNILSLAKLENRIGNNFMTFDKNELHIRKEEWDIANSDISDYKMISEEWLRYALDS